MSLAVGERSLMPGCEIAKTGCGCDGVLRSLSWSASIIDVLLILNLNGAGCANGRKKLYAGCPMM